MENISKRQAFLEFCVTKLYDLFEGIIGEHGRRYIPILATLILYIGFANIIGIFGFKSPTKDMNVTVALSVIAIVLIEYATFHARGFKGFFKSFTEPVAIVTPINILELIIRPLSLCMRLFGNVLGAFIVMELIKYVVPIFVPMVLSLYFDIFDGLIQAYVFVFLTSLFIKEAIEVEAPEPKEVEREKKRRRIRKVKEWESQTYRSENYRSEKEKIKEILLWEQQH